MTTRLTYDSPAFGKSALLCNLVLSSLFSQFLFKLKNPFFQSLFCLKQSFTPIPCHFFRHNPLDLDHLQNLSLLFGQGYESLPCSTLYVDLRNPLCYYDDANQS